MRIAHTKKNERKRRTQWKKDIKTEPGLYQRKMAWLLYNSIKILHGEKNHTNTHKNESIWSTPRWRGNSTYETSLIKMISGREKVLEIEMKAEEKSEFSARRANAAPFILAQLNNFAMISQLKAKLNKTAQKWKIATFNLPFIVSKTILSHVHSPKLAWADRNATKHSRKIEFNKVIN